MKNYNEIIKKEGRDPKFYIPVLELFEKSKNPLSIKEVAKSLNISYSAAKPRLHKLSKYGLLSRMKRGYYCLYSDFSKYNEISKPLGKLFFVNGCVRYKGNPRGVCINIYNSKFGEIAYGKYCRIKYYDKNIFILRKTNKFYGSKIYLLPCKSTGVSISRSFIPIEILNNLSNKSTQIKIGLYLDDWNISVKELFGSESKEEGELAFELEKIGDIEKKNKFDEFKADILFKKGNVKIPIEITTTNPLQNESINKSRRSGVKSSLILARFYFFIKWNFVYKSPTVLIIHKGWQNYGWIKKEEEYMKRFDCNIIFTDFKGKWAKRVSQQINLLI